MQKNLPEWLTSSVLILILVNLIPVYAVFFLGWKVFLVILIFWIENVIVGVFNVLRMLLVSPESRMTWLAKLFLIPFFCVHYGMFTMVHGMFVFILFGRDFIKTTPQGLPDIVFMTEVLREYYFIFAILAFAVSHGFSFFWNYIGKGEFRRVSLNNLMEQPYGRVVVLHITILASGFLVMALNSPIIGLLVLIALKIGMDIRAHLAEHRRLEKNKEG